RAHLSRERAAVGDSFDFIAGDLVFLARHTERQEEDCPEDPRDADALAQLYEQFMRAKPYYDQIRLIGADGRERVRINNADGQPERVPDEALQNKQDRYYFREGLAMHGGEVYVSPLDLNVENGEVERPFKPMLRFVTPVFGPGGEKAGVVVLNFLAGTLLDRVRSIGAQSRGRSLLLNGEGYWIIGPAPEREWGFMFPGREGERFASERPDAWARIRKEKTGQFQDGVTLYTFETIDPLKGGHASPGGPAMLCTNRATYHWVLLSMVDENLAVGPFMQGINTSLGVLGAGLFVFFSVGAWLLASATVRRLAAQREILRLARHDALTGLPNRVVFEDRLQVALAASGRSGAGVGLLFIDLDGFKAVNDTLGHAAGDELLQRVAGALTGALRTTDTVARLGGDEFAALLPGLGSAEEAVRIGEKIVAALSAPFALAAGPARIGASVGAAFHPEHAEDADELLKRADEAMYRAKQSGKNRCLPAEPATPSS
ncbi:MAG: diguanylate cyclase, partial [Desulfovibrionaceae bacterium]